MSSMNQNPILVKFHATVHFVSIRTVTKQRKSPCSFSLPRSAFIGLESEGRIVVNDSCSFAVIRLSENNSLVQFDFTWLSKYGDDTVKGFAQTVTLDYHDLTRHATDSLREGGSSQWSMLSINYPEKYPKLDFSAPGAQRAIRDILAVPVLRHKFTRAVRDNFKWPHPADDHVIRFYADGKYSFFFREYTDGKEAVCGGLILHRYDGLEKSYYGVHT